MWLNKTVYFRGFMTPRLKPHTARGSQVTMRSGQGHRLNKPTVASTDLLSPVVVHLTGFESVITKMGNPKTSSKPIIVKYALKTLMYCTQNTWYTQTENSA